MKRSYRSVAIEPLGNVLGRDPDLRVPSSIEVSPVAFRDWEGAVGTRIAARARPVRLDRGVLLVRTASSTWAQELALLADAILVQLRRRGVAVEALRFRVGPVDAPERPPTRDEQYVSPPEVELPLIVRTEVDRITDPELREIIARAASKNLGWQTTLKATPQSATAPEARAATRAPGGGHLPAMDKATAGDALRKGRATSGSGGAPGPRSAETRSAPQGRTRTSSSAGKQGKS
jgi:hypothetical protein